MKKIFAMVVILGLLAGCATIGVLQDENATAADKKAALCKDAQAGYNLADSMLADPAVIKQAEASAYWNTYKIGAKLVIDANCGVAAAK